MTASKRVYNGTNRHMRRKMQALNKSPDKVSSGRPIPYGKSQGQTRIGRKPKKTNPK